MQDIHHQQNIKDQIYQQQQLNKEPHHHQDESHHESKGFNFSIYEYLMSGLVVIFLITWYLGKTKNENLAIKWFNANKSFFTYNYAHIGHENNYSQFNMSSPFL